MKKRIVSVFLLLSFVFVGCTPGRTGANATTKSSRENPLLPGQTALFDTMGTGEQGVKAEVTLLDIYRGDVSTNYVYFSEPPTSDQEVIIAKFNIKVLESVNDAALNYPEYSFSLVSGKSKSYPRNYAYTTGKAKKDLSFVDIYPGGEDTAHVLFVVDKEDADPFIVFNQGSPGSPLWFKTTLSEDQKLSEDEQIVLSDFGIKGDGEQEGLSIEGADFTETYGGSLTNPLAIGNWAVYNYISDYSTDTMSLEVEFLEYLEGTEAEEIAYPSTSPRSSYNSKPDNQKLAGFKFKMNLVEYQASYSQELSPNFEVIDSTGKVIDSSSSYVYGVDSSIELKSFYKGGSQEGWYFVYLPDTIENPRISYKEYSVPSIWFSTDPAVRNQDKQYTPVYDASKYGVDASADLGTLENPATVGEIVSIDVDEDNKSVAYDMELKSVIYGTEAEKFLKSDGVDRLSDISESYQYVVADFLFVAKRTDSNETFNSTKYMFTPILNSINYGGNSPSIWGGSKEIKEVYPSEETNEGYIVFLLPKDTKELKILFKPLYSSTGSSCYKYEFPDAGNSEISNNSSEEPDSKEVVSSKGSFSSEQAIASEKPKAV